MSKTSLGAGKYTVIALTVLVLGASGCKKDRQLNPDFDDESAGGASSADRGGTRNEFSNLGNSPLPDIDQENLMFDPNSDSGLQRIYFDFDSSELRPDALSTLADNAEKIRQVPGVIVQIEGHCDERGTQEYNLALGERRALAVREYLIRLGISSDRLVTISYGEEDPADPGHDEAAWARNRRCEFNRAM